MILNIQRNPEGSPVHADSPMRGVRRREAAAAAVRAVTAADIRDRVRRAVAAEAMQAGAGPQQAPGVVAAAGPLEAAVDAAVITDGSPRTDRT